MVDKYGSKKEFERFWQKIEDRYKYIVPDAHSLTQSGYMTFLSYQFLEKRFSHKRGLISIECGSGTASTSLYFRKRGYRTVLFDVSQKALEIARDNYKREREAGYAVRGDVLSLSFKDDAFDVVFSLGLLEHFENVTEVLKEMVRVLKPGGLFFASIVTKRFSPQTLADYIYHLPGVLIINFLRLKPAKGIREARSYLIHKGYENDYSTAEYRGFLCASGLTEVKLYSLNPFPYLILPAALERSYVRLIKAILKIRQAFGNPEPLTTSPRLGRVWYAFGTKPQHLSPPKTDEAAARESARVSR